MKSFSLKISAYILKLCFTINPNNVIFELLGLLVQISYKKKKVVLVFSSNN